MGLLITKASYKRRLRGIEHSKADLAVARAKALSMVREARGLPPGKRRLQRETAYDTYITARAMLASARGQIVNVDVMRG